MFQLKYFSLLVLQAIVITQLMIGMFARSDNISFELTFHRVMNQENVITLRCLNASALKEPRAVFFLNGSKLSSTNYPGFFSRASEPGMITFKIKRSLEGLYSCGVAEVRSSPIALIGKLL